MQGSVQQLVHWHSTGSYHEQEPSISVSAINYLVLVSSNLFLPFIDNHQGKQDAPKRSEHLNELRHMFSLPKCGKVLYYG